MPPEKRRSASHTSTIARRMESMRYSYAARAARTGNGSSSHEGRDEIELYLPKDHKSALPRGERRLLPKMLSANVKNRRSCEPSRNDIMKAAGNRRKQANDR